MSDLPTVQPEKPAEPDATQTRARISPVDIIAFLCQILAFVTLGIWGFVSFEMPWNFVAGIGAPLLAILLWALFVTPKAVIPVHPFVRALVELLVFASATMAWWDMGAALVGIAYGVVAVASGLMTGLRRFA